MSSFVAETAQRWGDPQIRAFNDAEELTAWLAGIVERRHYTGDGEDILFIAEYCGFGKLRRLRLRRLAEVAAGDDYLEMYVLDPVDGDGPAAAEFSVRSGGRS